jgi:hypothetical protein
MQIAYFGLEINLKIKLRFVLCKTRTIKIRLQLKNRLQTMFASLYKSLSHRNVLANEQKVDSDSSSNPFFNRHIQEEAEE